MFLFTRSPKGGKKLTTLWTSSQSTCNTDIKPDKEPSIVQDYLVFKIGYAAENLKSGDPIYIKRSDAKHLAPLLTGFM